MIGKARPRRRGLELVLVVAAAATLAACQSPPTRAPSAPELRLLDAGALALPGGCEPASGVVYRTSYQVQADGRVATAWSESGRGCVQDALRRWVETFRYAPLAGPVPAAIDWMAVSATRGG